jgi:hypothetical protein
MKEIQSDGKIKEQMKYCTIGPCKLGPKKIIILGIVLCGCETRFLTLRMCVKTWMHSLFKYIYIYIFIYLFLYIYIHIYIYILYIFHIKILGFRSVTGSICHPEYPEILVVTAQHLVAWTTWRP